MCPWFKAFQETNNQRSCISGTHHCLQSFSTTTTTTTATNKQIKTKISVIVNNKSCDRWLKRLFFPFLACPFHFYLKMCVLTLVNNNWVTSRTFSKPRYDMSLHCTAPTLTPFSSSSNNSKSLTNRNDNQWFTTELEEFFSHWTATILITSNLTKRLSKSWQILTKEKLGKSWFAPSGR